MKRVTLLTVNFASGTFGPTIFIVDVASVRWRVVVQNNRYTTQSLVDCLPRGSRVTSHQDVAGMDKDIFLRWEKGFVKDVEDLTVDGRKVFLTYDG